MPILAPVRRGLWVLLSVPRDVITLLQVLMALLAIPILLGFRKKRQRGESRSRGREDGSWA